MSDLAKKMIQDAAVYVPFNCEGIRISYCDDDGFVGEGEETGEQYRIAYEEVDLAHDLIYRLELVNA